MRKRRNGFRNRPSEAISIAKRRDTAKTEGNLGEREEDRN